MDELWSEHTGCADTGVLVDSADATESRRGELELAA